MDRRRFLFLLLAASCVATQLAWAPQAAAKDGSDDGGSDDSGHGGDDDGGSDGGSGGGDDHSGRDNGSDDDGNHDGGDDGKGGNEGSSGSGRSQPDRDHQRAREAVGEGRILPLKDILKRVQEMGGGRVISVNLDLEARKPFYTLKIQKGATVRTLKLDAASGRRLTLFGW
ncbi:hypothetical protein [Rhizobium sp. AG855]|uniref:PepSY domain-containing protein n=1 Tax=Rhizobium sp. AG855 TaxID=2183898 RepID=UPI000E733B66|nr:hypothetical protein [Rhizobium sp. AG855]RKE86559.1 hypothetical protein DFO46_3372 [Rhizobium sp. AG855]